MKLHGKIVVIKRSGADGTEFPLNAACSFGRKADCDIRIQIPQVSKEHCRIELNENKEVILTNLSSVNPTRVNGQVLQQSDRLKHGDVITIVDRSFRFEYPPAPTPKKKRSSITVNTETLQVLQDQQGRDSSTVEAGEKKISQVSTDPHLKDGTNNDNIQRSLEKTAEVESKDDGDMQASATKSPFNELYQMIKQSLDSKTPRKACESLPQTPASRFYTPKPASVRKVAETPANAEVKSTPKKLEADGNAEVENKSAGTPKSVKKQRKSLEVPASEMTGLVAEEKPSERAAEPATPTQETPRNKRTSSTPQKKLQATPQRFTASEVVQQISDGEPKSPARRRSKEVTPVKPAVTEGQEDQAEETEAQPSTPKTEPSPRTSPRSAQRKLKAQDVLQELEAAAAAATNEKRKTPKKRKSGGLSESQLKNKRVSFGNQLSPELFDKRLPPNSPLRRGAMPRRSLGVSKPKQSLLRRASVIGLIKEFELEHSAPGSPKVQSPAKTRTPSPGKKSPKAKTPSPAKKSPKAKTPSPKTPSPAKKSPKSVPAASKTPSPARGRSPSKDKSETPKTKKSPETPNKAASPAQSQSVNKKTPASKRRSSVVSPVVAEMPSETPLASGHQTPTLTGRFSVSRIDTPSPSADQGAAAAPEPSVPVTPKLPLRRKSMKKTPRRTPKSVMKNIVDVMRRRSGVSRASMKVNSWAAVVKLGKAKPQAVVHAKKTLTKSMRKPAVVKPKTPAKKLMDHVSTGHAASPVTIVVGKAHKQTVVQPTGAAPRLVHNIALLKKDMKMDEDLTGIAEIFSTPVSLKRRKSVTNVQSATKTPLGAPSSTVSEASVMNTPEETGEMVVSPLSVASTAKRERYNSEAVQRLLHSNEESSFVDEVLPLEMPADHSSERQRPDLNVKMATPKQKPAQPDCLTGVKRLLKTPRQKAEPVEDLRGKLLKTPKQKPEQPECLSGVKRIMKTPRQKVEPVDDLRGRLLKTPKAPRASEEVGLDGVKELLKTPKYREEPAEDLAEVMAIKTPQVKSSPMVCATGVKVMKTPNEKATPVEDMVGVKRLKSPRLRGNTPVEDVEGLQELMEEPLTSLGEQTETNEGQVEMTSDCGSDMTKEPEVACEEQKPEEVQPEEVQPEEAQPEEVPCAQAEDEPSDTEKVPQADLVNEPEVFCGDQPEEVPCDQGEAGPSDYMENVSQSDTESVCCGQLEEVLCVQGEDGPSDSMENVPKPDMTNDSEVVCGDQPADMPCAQGEDGPSNTIETVSQASVDQNLPEEQPKEEKTAGQVIEDTASSDPEPPKKTARGRRAKMVQPEVLDDTKQETAEDLEEAALPAPVRGRRGKKTEVVPPPTVRHTARTRGAKPDESKDVEVTAEASNTVATQEKVSLKSRRGRNAKQTSIEEAPVVEETVVEPEKNLDQAPPEKEPIDNAAPLEEPSVKPKRGRKTKQTSVKQAETEQEITEAAGDQPLLTNAQPEESVPAVAIEKPRRGRKVNQEKEAVEETVKAVAAELQSRAPVRAKRGRQTKQEEKVENDSEMSTAAAIKEPAVKSRGTRKTRQDPVEQNKEAEVQMIEGTITEKVEASVPASKTRRGRRPKQDSVETLEELGVESSAANPTEPVEVQEQAAKPRRGRREPNQEAKSVTPPESTEVQDKPAEKPKRGRRAKQETDVKEVEITSAVPEENAEHIQEEEKEQPDAPVLKPTRGRKANTAVKAVLPRATAAKRTHRGAAPLLQEAAVEEADVPASRAGSRGRAGKPSRAEDADYPAEVPAEPIKKGRRAAAKATVLPPDNAMAEPSGKETVEEKVDVKRGRVTRKGKAVSTTKGDQANAAEPVDGEAADDAEMPKKCVNWKVDLAETREIANATPVVKAARGRKAKLVEHEVSQDAPAKRGRHAAEPPASETTTSKPGSKRKASESASKAEEEDLSVKAAPAEPAKRARRGTKVSAAPVEAVAPVTEETETSQRSRGRGKALKKAAAVDTVTTTEAETQPKTRRGRAAKK
ncbi:proliferation marker protein Ki-67 [Polymixia lowei]